MPLVRSITALDDGFEIVTTGAGTKTVSSADLSPAQKLMTPTQLEAVVNAFLAARLPPNMFAVVILTSVVPLKGTLHVGNTPGQWWP